MSVALLCVYCVMCCYVIVHVCIACAQISVCVWVVVCSEAELCAWPRIHRWGSSESAASACRTDPLANRTRHNC